MRDLKPDVIAPLSELLNQEDYPNKPYVLLAYYDTLEETYIDKARAANYLALLAGFTGRFYLYFSNADNYIKVDKLFLVKALKVLLNNASTGTGDFILNDEFMERHANDIRSTSLMEKAYLEMISKEDHYDHDGSELLVILKRRPTFYLKVLERLADERHINRSDNQKIGKAWKLDNTFAILEKAVNFLAAYQSFHFYAEELLADLFDNSIKIDQFGEKRLAFLRIYIEKHADNLKKMQAIFKVISGRVRENFAELLDVYLKANKNFDHFAKIRWTESGTRVISGDAISAEIDERAWQRVKETLDKIQPSADYLEHRVFVGKQIAYCQRDAVRERKRNFLRDEF